MYYLTVIFTIFVSINIVANDQPNNCYPGHQYNVTHDDFKEESFDDYLVEECTDMKRDINGLRVCPDGSYTFDQPNSQWLPILEQNPSLKKMPLVDILKNSEGFCGQTAFANIVKMNCGDYISPTNANKDFLNEANRLNGKNKFFNQFSIYENVKTSRAQLIDALPGIYPSTLKNALNRVYKDSPYCGLGKWKWYSAKKAKDFLFNIRLALSQNSGIRRFKRKRKDSKIIERTPLATLVQIPNNKNNELHWITIVDYEDDGKNNSGCKITFNMYQQQYTAPCGRVADWSYGVYETYGLRDLTYATIQLELPK